MNHIPNFAKFFIDLLPSVEVGRGVWKIFGINMLDRFVNNNLNNFWDDDIVDLTAIMTPFKNDASNDETDKAFSMSITASKNIIINQFKTLAHDWHRTIVYLFPEKTPTYIEFYPHGLTGINKVTLTEIGVVMNNIITAADKYEAQLGVGFSAPMKTIRTNFHTISHTQNIQDSKIDLDKIELDNDVKNLKKIIAKLICGVAYRYNGFPEMINVYFDFSILKVYGHHKTKDGDIYNDIIAANTTIIISDTITAKSIITLMVEGTMPLTYWFTNIEDGPMGAGFTLNPGDELVIDMSAQDNPKLPYLKCTNPDATTTGVYFVEVK